MGSSSLTLEKAEKNAYIQGKGKPECGSSQVVSALPGTRESSEGDESDKME